MRAHRERHHAGPLAPAAVCRYMALGLRDFPVLDQFVEFTTTDLPDGPWVCPAFTCTCTPPRAMSGLIDAVGHAREQGAVAPRSPVDLTRPMCRGAMRLAGR